MQDIYNFLSTPSVYREEKFKIILDITDVLHDERNLATHKKLYSKEEIENLLKKLIPLLNKFISLTWQKIITLYSNFQKKNNQKVIKYKKDIIYSQLLILYENTQTKYQKRL